MKGKGEMAMEQVMRSPQSSTAGALPAGQGVKDAFGIKARLLRGEVIKNQCRAQRRDKKGGELDDEYSAAIHAMDIITACQQAIRQATAQWAVMEFLLFAKMKICY
jgi:hypothetical protein